MAFFCVSFHFRSFWSFSKKYFLLFFPELFGLGPPLHRFEFFCLKQKVLFLGFQAIVVIFGEFFLGFSPNLFGLGLPPPAFFFEILWLRQNSPKMQNRPWGKFFSVSRHFRSFWSFFKQIFFIVFPHFFWVGSTPPSFQNFLVEKTFFLAVLDHCGHFWNFFWFFSKLFWVAPSSFLFGKQIWPMTHLMISLAPTFGILSISLTVQV